MPTDEQVQKYLKVKALAERGDGGERESAKKILAKMAKDYPGIEAAALAWERKNAQSNQPPEPEPEPEPESDPFADLRDQWEESQSPRSRRNWSDLIDIARAAMNNAYDFANHVANAYIGRNLAEEHVQATTKASKAGNILITLKMPVPVYTHAVQSLNEVQRQAFRQVMHELLEDQIVELFGNDED